MPTIVAKLRYPVLPLSTFALLFPSLFVMCVSSLLCYFPVLRLYLPYVADVIQTAPTQMGARASALVFCSICPR